MIDGNRLRMLRKQIRFTAEELGQVLGVSGQQVLRYETGQSDTTTEMLVKIANFFDVSTDYLLDRTDNPRPYEKRNAVLTWRVDTTGLLKTFEPEFIGRVVRGLGVATRADQEEIRVSELLKEYPPETVAAFVRALGLKFTVVPDEDSDSSLP